MQMDIAEALKWPYKKENWMPAIVIPGAAYIGIIVFMACFYFVAFAGLIGVAALGSASEEMGIVAMLFVFLGYIVVMMLAMLLFAPIYGYFWEVVHVLRTEGYDADSPTWSGRVKEYFINGLKVACFYIVLNVFYMSGSLMTNLIGLPFGDAGAIISGVLSVFYLIFCFLLIPYFYTPFIHSAESKSLKALFNFKKTFEAGTQCYLNVLLMFLVIMVLSMCYMVAVLISMCTVVGPPFVMSAMWVSSIHLFVQAFDDYEDDGSELPA